MAFCEVKPEYLRWVLGYTHALMKEGKTIEQIISEVRKELPGNQPFLTNTLLSNVPVFMQSLMAEDSALGDNYAKNYVEIQEIRKRFEGPDGYIEVAKFNNNVQLKDEVEAKLCWNGKCKTTLERGEIFDGYFKDGMKDGLGSLIFPNGTKYEGEFREGKYHGKGMLTYSNGKKYHGEFIEGKFDGKGILTHSDGDKYEGEFKDGKYHGKGIYYFASGTKYEGEFREGKYHGKGILTYSNLHKYEGNFINDKYEGFGIETYNGDKYEGEFKEGEYSGKGILTYSSGKKYHGEFIEGKFDGKGILTHSDGDKYEGEFKDGKYHGKGIYYFVSGTKYEGEFKEGKYNGKGILTYSNEGKYEGDFIDGNYDGFGIASYSNGEKYEGEFKNAQRHGRGILTRKGGYKYEGYFSVGLFEGFGIETLSIKNKYEGEFKNGKRHGKGVLNYSSNTLYQGRFINVIIEGDFKGGIVEGYGVEVLSNGEKYEGEFKDGQRHGKGILTYINGDKYEGEFKNGIEDGKGILIYAEGYNYESKFDRGKHVGKGIVSYSGLKRNLEDLENNFFNFINLKFDNAIKINNSVKSDNYYVFFDVETTGLPKRDNAPATDLDNWPRLVQLAYMVFDKQGNKILEENFIIKPEGFSISEDSIAIHNITNERAKKEGRNLSYVLKEFKKQIGQATCLVAHNIAFDEKIIESEFIRSGITNILPNKKKVCTMKSTINFCKIYWNGKYKWPKLEELYFKLFEEKYDDSHNALADIRATAKCFWKLVKLGEIKLDDIENNDVSIFTWWEVVKHKPNKFTFHESLTQSLSEIVRSMNLQKDLKYFTKDDLDDLYTGQRYNSGVEKYPDDLELIRKIESIDIKSYNATADLFDKNPYIFKDEIDLEIASNIKPISNFKYLKSIKYNKISFDNFNYLASLKNLERLVFVSCENFSLNTISKLENLKTLSFINCHFDEFRANVLLNQLDFISRLKKIEYLTIEECKSIDDLSPLKNHNSLKNITLKHTNINSLEPIAFNYILESIDFSYNKLKEIKCIVNLRNLNTIRLTNNMISDFTVLGNLTNIKKLSISRNPIKNIDFAIKLTNLEKIDIRKCEIESLSPLYNLSKLKVVICDENQFSDLEIDRFKKVKPECYIGVDNDFKFNLI